MLFPGRITYPVVLDGLREIIGNKYLKLLKFLPVESAVFC